MILADNDDIAIADISYELCNPVGGIVNVSNASYNPPSTTATPPAATFIGGASDVLVSRFAWAVMITVGVLSGLALVQEDRSLRKLRSRRERVNSLTEVGPNLTVHIFEAQTTLLMVQTVWFQTQTGPITRFKWLVVWFKSQTGPTIKTKWF